jgi:apolipoprotein N-acyltransferase
MVRSTNTGVTAAIDERGEVVARLPVFENATLYADIVPRDGMTPYARMGNLAVLAIVAGLLAGVRVRRGR